MARKSLLSTALVLLAATCSAEPPAFYNPANGAIAECRGSELDPYGDRCIATYERAGWVKYAQPIINRETPPATASP
jgi:hypothetical protein